MAVFSRLLPVALALSLAGGALAQSPREGRSPRESAPRAAAPAPADGKAQDGKTADGKPRPPMTREAVLNELYDRLAKTEDAEEGKGIATAIERVNLRSGSDTADLLMTRAIAAAHRNNAELAEDLVDRILLLEPDWAEAWHRRATLRVAREDISGGLEDLAQALKRDARHIGALAGLGFTLLKQENKPQALRVLRRLLELYPQFEPAKKAVERLGLELDGRTL
ncbi:MAG: hypothetical protein JNK46_10765 [Methylobacteriaceae bacterium]|nr:hypothetical protein [Methylobacteriaceae bacterium]